jgi:hypothetical protein
VRIAFVRALHANLAVARFANRPDHRRACASVLRLNADARAAKAARRAGRF